MRSEVFDTLVLFLKMIYIKLANNKKHSKSQSDYNFVGVCVK